MRGSEPRVPAAGEQPVGAQRAGGEHDAAGGDLLAAAAAAAKRAAVHVRDRVALSAVRGAHGPHVGDCALRVDPHPEALGEPQIVLHERVLGPVAAADHALPATQAAGPGRTVPFEIRVGMLNTRRTEIDPHARVAVGVLDAERAGQLAQEDVAV